MYSLGFPADGGTSNAALVLTVEQAAGHPGKIRVRSAQNVGVSAGWRPDFPAVWPYVHEALLTPNGSNKHDRAPSLVFGISGRSSDLTLRSTWAEASRSCVFRMAISSSCQTHGTKKRFRYVPRLVRRAASSGGPDPHQMLPRRRAAGRDSCPAGSRRNVGPPSRPASGRCTRPDWVPCLTKGPMPRRCRSLCRLGHRLRSAGKGGTRRHRPRAQNNARGLPKDPMRHEPTPMPPGPASPPVRLECARKAMWFGDNSPGPNPHG